MEGMDFTRVVLAAIRSERERQVAKWGEQSHPPGINQPGDAERCTAIREDTNYAAGNGTLTWRDILDEEVAEVYAAPDERELREELVQVAAVATAWIEEIDKRFALIEIRRAWSTSLDHI